MDKNGSSDPLVTVRLHDEYCEKDYGETLAALGRILAKAKRRQESQPE